MAEEEPKLVSKTALEKAFKGLKRISRGFDPIKSLAEMMADAEDDNDRVVALVSGSHVENALVEAIKKKMRPLSAPEEYELFGVGSPLGTFSNKIKVGYGLSIFSLRTKNNLNILREIRNAFAHARDSVKFKTKERKPRSRRLPTPSPAAARCPQLTTMHDIVIRGVTILVKIRYGGRRAAVG